MVAQPYHQWIVAADLMYVSSETVKPQLWQPLSQHFREFYLQPEEIYGWANLVYSRIQAAVRAWRSYALCHAHAGFF
jgi:hypothetical protein